MSVIESLQWRYASKAMNGAQIEVATLDYILEAIRLSASSYGLQPFTVQVISNAELKNKLTPAAYNQPQINKSSQLLVFCVWNDVTEAHVDAYMQDMAEQRVVSIESLAGFKAMILGALKNLSVEQKQTWAAKQAYIALGTAMVAAAEQKVDATPMEGFNAQQVDEILGLDKQGLKSTVLLVLGKRSTEDALASMAKVRRSKDDLFNFLN
jgi:nitroreductase/dihydropteridine reductase